MNKVFFEISSSQEKQCLTINTRDVNALESLRRVPIKAQVKFVIIIEIRQAQVLINF